MLIQRIKFVCSKWLRECTNYCMNPVFRIFFIMLFIFIPCVSCAYTFSYADFCHKNCDSFFLISEEAVHYEDVIVFPELDVCNSVFEGSNTTSNINGVSFTFRNNAGVGSINNRSDKCQKQSSGSTEQPNISFLKFLAENVHIPSIKTIGVFVMLFLIFGPIPKGIKKIQKHRVAGGCCQPQAPSEPCVTVSRHTAQASSKASPCGAAR